MTAVERVEASAWVRALVDAHAAGFTMLDLLTGVDRGGHVEVIARIVDPVTANARLLSTDVAGQVDSVTSVYPGAGWHERETAEMFGIAFAGLADDRPLLLRELTASPPLRKSTLLAERVEREWPGAGGNRRTRPLGVPAEVAKGRS